MTQTSTELIGKLKPYPQEHYEHLDLNSLAAYTIWWLKQNNILVTFENVCVALFLMFPAKFSMVGYPQYPDSSRVLRSLLQLRPKYRNWATGDSKRGFNLTANGLAIAEKTAKLLQNPELQEKKELPKTTRGTRVPQEEVKKITSSQAFRKYLNHEYDKIDKLEILEIMKAVPYTPPKVLRRYLDELQSIAQDSENKDASEFLSWVRKQFPSLFAERR